MERKKIISIIVFSALGLTFVWSLLFSSNSIFKCFELDRENKALEESIAKTRNSIENHYTYEELVHDDALLEQYAREQLNMQKENEDVFVIVYE